MENTLDFIENNLNEKSIIEKENNKNSRRSQSSITLNPR